MPVTSKKRRRDQRHPHPTAIRLTVRDQAIVRAVHDYRALRQDQLAHLFARSRSVMQRVLIRLYDHGFLQRRFPAILGWNSPTVYVLDKHGAELLRAVEGLEALTWYPSSTDLKPYFLAHTTGINDIRIAITLAAQAEAYALLRWIGERELKADYDRVNLRTASGKSRSVSLIPDGYLVLQTPKGIAHCFLELDRGTESASRFQSKIAAYLSYHQSGAYKRRYQASTYRLLTVTTSARRLARLKAVTEAAGGRDRFWFTTLDQLTAERVFSAPIWQVAGRGETAFDFLMTT